MAGKEIGVGTIYIAVVVVLLVVYGFLFAFSQLDADWFSALFIATPVCAALLYRYTRPTEEQPWTSED